MKKFENTVNVKEIVFTVRGLYKEGRDTPSAYSHDDPKFSDTGDGVEIEDIEIFIGDQEVSDIITDEIKSEVYNETLSLLD
jgi:hypothetical protein